VDDSAAIIRLAVINLQYSSEAYKKERSSMYTQYGGHMKERGLLQVENLSG